MVVAGRVLYRDGCVTVVVGRVLYRGGRLVMPCGFTVMRSLCSGREKVRPVRSNVNANAKKFAQRGKNDLKIAVYGVLGEFFRENAAGVPLLGEFFRARAQMGLCWPSIFARRA